MMLTLTPPTLHGSRSPFEKIILEAEEIPRYNHTQYSNKNSTDYSCSLSDKLSIHSRFPQNWVFIQSGLNVAPHVFLQ